MKLWYQSLTRPDAWPTYAKALRWVLDAGADPGTEIAIHGIEKRGGIGDQYRYLEFIETAEVLENVARAEAEGFDAVLLGNIVDPGLRIARENGRHPGAWAMRNRAADGLPDGRFHRHCLLERQA
jgi:allantoin racemase